VGGGRNREIVRTLFADRAWFDRLGRGPLASSPPASQMIRIA
jgi:hypothetical protein